MQLKTSAPVLLLSRDTIRLLRIPFSFFLLPVFLLALCTAPQVAATDSIFAFLIIHLLVYPASNGYNSYVDRDEGSIGGLRNPPQPTRELYYVTMIMDVAALTIGAIAIGLPFACCILLYILASRAYSSPVIRLKKRPWAGFLTVVFFQGAFTYFFSYIGITGKLPELNTGTLCLMGAASAQIAGAYPLTQIYQHEEDMKRGDITMSMRLGYSGTFAFSAAMFALAMGFYAVAFYFLNVMQAFLILQLFFVIPVIYFISWYNKVRRDASHAGFDQAMSMSRLASVSMSVCFIFLFMLRSFT
jgi:4-hydroxybenzoate polyprenyltransferase